MLASFDRHYASNIVHRVVDQRMTKKKGNLKPCSPAVNPKARTWRGMGKGDGLLASLGRDASMVVKRPKDVDNLNVLIAW